MLKIFSQISDFFKTAKTGDVSAIILCAGNSTRFSNGKESKQLTEICGKKVIVHTIEAFEKCHNIREIILVVRKEDANSYNSLVYENAFQKVECIVVGGETRQISAMRGFKHVSSKSKYVAIHDGARCLVTPQTITQVIREAREYDAATAANKVNDTIKASDEAGFISKTISRENIWTVQTPQVFSKDLYKLCIEHAKLNGFSATDDCMLAEAYGHKVKLVETSAENIKITTKDDLKRAESILLNREEETV